VRCHVAGDSSKALNAPQLIADGALQYRWGFERTLSAPQIVEAGALQRRWGIELDNI
jgi:hypothetical protein